MKIDQYQKSFITYINVLKPHKLRNCQCPAGTNKFVNKNRLFVGIGKNATML